MIPLCDYCHEVLEQSDEDICAECGWCQICEQFDYEGHLDWCDNAQ